MVMACVTVAGSCTNVVMRVEATRGWVPVAVTLRGVKGWTLRGLSQPEQCELAHASDACVIELADL